MKYCDLKNISPRLLALLQKHSPEGHDAEKLDSLLADGVRCMSIGLYGCLAQGIILSFAENAYSMASQA